MDEHKCIKCNATFQYASYLKRHILTAVKCKANFKNGKKIITDDIKCIKCNKIFTKKSSLVFHNNNSKCGKNIITKVNIDLTLEDIDNITSLEEAKNIMKTKLNPLNLVIPQNPLQNKNIINNTINNTTNNIVNQDNRQITINQSIINVINPFANESIPNLTFDEMMTLLNNVDKPEIEILKLVYSDIQNNNFFKYNMGKQDVSYLTSNNSIDTVQEEQFRQQILKNGKDLLKKMLLICTKELTIKDLSRIYIRIDNIDNMLKDAVYDIDLTNYLYTYFRQHSKNTKKKLTTFVSTINDNPEVKNKMNKMLEDNKIIKEDQRKLLTPEISLGEINVALGDLTLAKELDFETTVNDFLLKKFEDTSYYNYMHLRIKNESEFIKKHPNASLGDHIELNKREKLILDSLDKMKELHTEYKKDDLLLIEIPQVYKTETARKTVKDKKRNKDTNMKCIKN
jgi:hypothetical protein